MKSDQEVPKRQDGEAQQSSKESNSGGRRKALLRRNKLP